MAASALAAPLVRPAPARYLLLAIIGSAGAAWAQPSARSAPEPVGDVAVEIAVVGTPEDLQRIRSVIEPGLLGGAAPRWSRVASFDPMGILQLLRTSPITNVRCWVDVSDPGRARLYFAARPGDRFLVRDVEMSGHFNEVDRESLSHVLELSVTALLEDEKAGLTRTEAQAVLAGRPQTSVPPTQGQGQSGQRTAPLPDQPTDQPADQQQTEPPRQKPATEEIPAHAPIIADRPPPGTGSATLLELSAFYGARVPGGGLPLAHGPGLSLYLELGNTRNRPTLAVWVSGEYQWPARRDAPSVGFEVRTVAARGGLELDVPLGAYRMGVRLGSGADLVRLSPQAGTADRSAMLKPTTWSSSLVFTAAIRIRRALGSHAWLGASILADALPTVTHYDVNVDGSTSRISAPNRIRPGLMLELAIR